MPQKRFIRARRSRNCGSIGRKCIRNNAAFAYIPNGIETTAKTVAHALEQLNQAKELQQK